jgi:hypothetical protein
MMALQLSRPIPVPGALSPQSKLSPCAGRSSFWPVKSGELKKHRPHPARAGRAGHRSGGGVRAVVGSDVG